MGFLDFIKSSWEWIKNAIQKVWARFKVFLTKVADYVHTVMGTLRKLAQKIKERIPDLVKKIKEGKKKFFLIFTSKKESGFKGLIEKAYAEGNGKINIVEASGQDILGEQAQSTHDIHLAQTDELFNTENVYSISPDQLAEDMRNKAAAADVHEIRFNW